MSDRLARVEQDLAALEAQQATLTAQWEGEKAKLGAVATLKEEIDQVQIEVSQAERDYDLNRAAELKYGSLMNLQRQLEEAEAAMDAALASGASDLLRDEVTPRTSPTSFQGRHPGVQAPGGRAREAPAPSRRAPQARRGPGRGGSR